MHTLHNLHDRQSDSPDVFDGIENEFSAEGLYALAYWFDDMKQTDRAIEYYHKALQADPGLAEAHYNMGVIYHERRESTKAVFHLKNAIRLKPHIAESYSVLGMICCSRGQYDEALVLLEQAVAIKPQFAEAHFNLGIIRQHMGEYQRGLNSFQSALASNPDFAPAHWLHLLSLPMIYDTDEQIAHCRQRFSQNLDKLVHSIKLETPGQVDYAMRGIGTATNFYLQYQGFNDRELQKKYGGLVHAVMSARYPQYCRRPSIPAPKPGEKIRIGYVSSFMYHHTVGTFLAGWVENHNPSDFEIYCYHVGQKTDAMTKHFKRISHRFHHFPENVPASAAQIAADRLHILIYSDIGMNTETLQLASLSLAPVQCKGWGHPVTTGLPTIDYYLSSDLMEPDDARAHYSESLVRLPNLALCYAPPRLPAAPIKRETLAITDDRFIFLSPQSIFKYLPRHDEVYPVIAQKAPGACFVFVSHQSRYATERFRNRLRRAFDRYHLDADRFCFFSPRLQPDDFLALNMMADALLDTLDWSGGKTTLEAISCGLPVVTCPGKFMRGRHAFAMLTMMGITATIADNLDGYCRIAVRLANEESFYKGVKTAFTTQRHKLYHDRIFIAELEKFYHSVSGARSDPRNPAGAINAGTDNARFESC